jgi:hypothetical protein
VGDEKTLNYVIRKSKQVKLSGDMASHGWELERLLPILLNLISWNLRSSDMTDGLLREKNEKKTGS